jgi:hypothetical protein
MIAEFVMDRYGWFRMGIGLRVTLMVIQQFDGRGRFIY